ncbi:hypothetical protein DM860_012135 [Cuscuta australis]|uniref:Uncharacterized protein n=1 Tax=Cuscuta australis TaxID=267555 RepID=A0A328D904_9ASTE|nr:hypothetical protein DM860_012135 [Cuscuta australis]
MSPPSSLFSILCSLLILQALYLLCSPLGAVGSKVGAHRTRHHNGGSPPKLRAAAAAANLSSSCSLFQGSWVVDQTYPLYKFSDCPALIDTEFNCQMYGRPDSDYLRFRWKPANCEIPRFDGVKFLEKMKGKKVMFVGDSLGLNQWESLICMLSASVPGTQTKISRSDPLSNFTFLEYGVTVSFYRAPYLVDIESVEGKKVLKLQDISKNGYGWRNVDVLSFNTGHWWVHKGSLQGWNYMEKDGVLHEDMDRLDALEEGLRTWARWVDSNLDPTRTRVFFQGISPTHYNPREWSAGTEAVSKTCYGETTPTTPRAGGAYPGTYPEQMKVIQGVVGSMSHPTFLLDISLLSAMRKDAHPSIYNGDLTPAQRANPDRSSDCSHWCLPGLPDTWNQLFYTALFS